MKKNFIFIILGILGILLALIISGIALFSSLTKEKESINAEEFKTIMQEKGFIVSDATSQFSQYDYIKQVYVAASDDYSYKIEFYELSDIEYATSFYNNNKAIFESSKGIASANTSVSIKNYSKYTLSTNGQYKVVSRIDNTVIYLDVDSGNKDAVKDLLKEIGY